MGSLPAWLLSCCLWPCAITAQVEWRRFEFLDPRDRLAMATDTARSRVVMFGGFTATGARDETWEWDGTAGGAFPVMRRLADTWSWDGSRWLLAARAPTPAAASDAHALAEDPALRRVLFFGGAELWQWDGSQWRFLEGDVPPRARPGAGMAWDRARNRLVLGGASNPYFFDTWEWDGTSWQQYVPIANPPSLKDLAFAYDARRARTVLFGGLPQDHPEWPPSAETFEWDGTSWTRMNDV